MHLHTQAITHTEDDRTTALDALVTLFHAEAYALALAPFPRGPAVAEHLQERLQQYDALLLALGASGREPLHWRTALLGLRFLAALLRPGCREDRGVRVPAALVPVILERCLHENPEVRDLALGLLVTLCALHKPDLPPQPMVDHPVVFPVPDKTCEGYYAPAAPAGPAISSPLDVHGPCEDGKMEFFQMLQGFFFAPEGMYLLDLLFADVRCGSCPVNLQRMAVHLRGLQAGMLDEGRLDGGELEEELGGQGRWTGDGREQHCSGYARG